MSIRDVLEHYAPGFFWIPITNGSIDFFVEHEGPVDRDAVGQLSHACQHRSMYDFEQQMANTIAAGTKNAFMESHIGIQSRLVTWQRKLGDMGTQSSIFPQHALQQARRKASNG